MHLKILLVPFCVVMVLVLAIGYINPDFIVMQTKKQELVTKTEQSNNMETLLSNIGSLVGSIESQGESERFILNYFPKDLDQGRVIDAFNYSALQSGVIVNSITIEEPQEEIAFPVEDLSGMPIETDASLLTPNNPTSKTYTATVTVKGSYENIKTFLSRATHMNRFHKLKSFSVGFTQQDLDNPDADVVSGLTGTFQADFDYLKSYKVDTALNRNVFQSSTLNLSSLQGAKEWVTNFVPLLEKPLTGKPNPFQ